MYRLAEQNDGQATTLELAEALGFDAEEGGRPVGMRLAWMRRYGMVAFDETERHWSLSRSGQRVAAAHLRAPEMRVVEKMPDEKMVEMMALVTSRFQRGEAMLANLLRREFLYGTKRQ
jgi:hypothetical protein